MDRTSILPDPGPSGSPAHHRDAAAVGLATLIAIAFWVRWHFLTTASSMPLGIDGFYYAVQLRSLLAGQGLYYPASPVAFWSMLPGAWALGPIDGAKLGAALGTALAAAPVYAIVRRATGASIAGLLGAALTATAAGGFQLAAEFVKQGIGLTFALTCVATLAGALESPKGRGRGPRLALAALLFLATLLTHLTSVGVALLFALPLLWAQAIEDHPTDLIRPLVGAGGAVLAVALLVLLLVPTVRQGMGLGHLFGQASFAFLGDTAFHFEVALAALAALVTAVLLAPGRIPVRQRALLLGPVAFGLLLIFPWFSQSDPQGLTYRLRIMAFVPLAICAPVVLARLAARVPLLLPAGTLMVMLSLVPVHEPPHAVYQNGMFLPGAVAIADVTPPDAVILVDARQMAFMVKWAADREARTSLPPADDRRPLFRLVTADLLPPGVGRDLPAFEAALAPGLPPPVHLLPRHPQTMILFAEPTWQALLRRADPADRAALAPWKVRQ